MSKGSNCASRLQKSQKCLPYIRRVGLVKGSNGSVVFIKKKQFGCVKRSKDSVMFRKILKKPIMLKDLQDL